MAIMQDDVATRLVRKLGLKQTPGKDVTKKFAERTRELQRGRGLTDSQAAIVAANGYFSLSLCLPNTTLWASRWKNFSPISRSRNPHAERMKWRGNGSALPCLRPDD
jgi:hypothetical protein